MSAVLHLHETTAREMTEPQLPPQRIDEVRRRARAFHEEHRSVSQRQVATRAAVAPATYSQFLSGSYSGDNSKVARKVEAFLDDYAYEERLSEDIPFVETSAAARIETAILTAETTRRIAIVTGVSGCGITRTLMNHCRRNPNARVLTASPAIDSPRSILNELLILFTRVPIAAQAATADAFRRLVDALKANADQTIIVDEAEQLSSPTCTETLRSVADAAGVGLVLAGDLSIYQHGPGRGTARTGQAATKLQRRVIARVLLNADVFAEDDVRLIANQLADETALSREVEAVGI